MHEEIGPKQASARIFVRLANANHIVIILNASDEEYIYARGVAQGLAKHLNVKEISSTNAEKLSEDERKELIESTDLLLAFGFGEDLSKAHCFVLDAKNNGVLTVAVNQAGNKFLENFDITIIDQMPGFMRRVVRLCRIVKHEKTNSKVFRDENRFLDDLFIQSGIELADQPNW